MKGIPTLWKLRQERAIADGTLMLYFWLRHQADGEGRIVTSLRQLSEERDWSERTVSRHLDILVEFDLVRRVGAKGARHFSLEVSTGKENPTKALSKAKQTRKDTPRDMTPETSAVSKNNGNDTEQIYLTPETSGQTSGVSYLAGQVAENKDDPKTHLLIRLDSSLQEESSLGEGAPAFGAGDTSPYESAAGFFADMKTVLKPKRRR